MSDKIIKDFSRRIAEQIAERDLYDVEKIADFIKVQVEFCMDSIVEGYKTKAEKRYEDLLEEQSKNIANIRKYIELGYRLAIAKKRKAIVNRMQSTIKTQNKYKKLKAYIEKTCGEQMLEEFFIELEREDYYKEQ